jgi:hypothetical protein
MISNKIIEAVLQEASIKKQAELLSNIKRIVNLNLDDLVIEKGMKIVDLLNKLELAKESTLIEKQDLSEIKQKINKSMQMFQEAMESLFTLQERLIKENEINLQKK